MFFNVAQLLKEPTGATRTHELADNLGELDDGLEPLTPLVGTIRMLRTHSSILVTGELSIGLQFTCNRCLGPAVIPVRFQLEESFRPLTEVRTGRFIHPDEFEGEEENLEDAALLISEQHLLDLTEVVRQNIWLALPMYPTCSSAGLEQCPEKEINPTGFAPDFEPADADINENNLAGSTLIEGQIDPRWAALLDLPLNPDETN